MRATVSVEERRTERRARLLDAALEAFGTDRFQPTSIEGLCTRAKVATRSFYEEFESKEAVIIELHDAVNSRAYEAVASALATADPDDVAGRVRAGFRAYLDVMTADPRWARLAFREMTGATPATHAARRAALGRFADLIADEADRLATAGLVPARDFTLTATAVVGALTALVETWSTDGDHRRQRDRIADEATRLLLLALTDGDRRPGA